MEDNRNVNNTETSETEVITEDTQQNSQQKSVSEEKPKGKVSVVSVISLIGVILGIILVFANSENSSFWTTIIFIFGGLGLLDIIVGYFSAKNKDNSISFTDTLIPGHICSALAVGGALLYLALIVVLLIIGVIFIIAVVAGR